MRMITEQSEGSLPAPSAEDIEAAYKELDTNQDGRISMDEFKVLVVEILKAIDS
jgi:Ca2+-binding EF-hand superfamily protein